MTLTTTIMKRGIKAHKSKRVSDGSVKGFCARFSKRGEAEFILRYISPVTAKEAVYVLGKYGKLDGQLLIAAARVQAKVTRAKIDSGEDPKIKQKQEKVAIRSAYGRKLKRDVTISTLSARYLVKAQKNLRLATIKEKNMILKRLCDLCGDEDIGTIEREDALSMLDSQEALHGNGGAMKFIAHCSAFWNWTLEEGIHKGYNVWSSMKGRKKQYRAKPKSRWLDNDDLRQFITEVYPNLAPSIQRASLVSLYTNCRPAMAASLSVKNTQDKHNQKIGFDWSEIKWDRREWVLSSIRMKAHNEHVVPLSDQFYGLLREWWEADGKPSKGAITTSLTSKDKYLNGSIYAAAFKGQDYKPHDFRRTVSTQLQRLGCPDGVRKALRAHIDRSGVASVYDIHNYLPEREQWLQTWASHLDSLGFDTITRQMRCERLKINIIK